MTQYQAWRAEQAAKSAEQSAQDAKQIREATLQAIKNAKQHRAIQAERKEIEA